MTLNQTVFAKAQHRELEEAGPPVPVRALMGARSFSYSEAHGFGNPGHYQTFVLTASSASEYTHVDTDSLTELITTTGDRFDEGQTAVSSAGSRFRQRSVVTTFTVLGPDMPVDTYAHHFAFGPHGDEIRTLPAAG